jgi:hypothetical protein
MTTGKKPKKENPLALNAEVIGGSILHRRLGKIVRVTKTLLHVKWDSGVTECFGRQGQAFHGRPDAEGEAINFSKSGRPLENLWGGEDDPGISIATESAKAQIMEERAKKERLKQEREQQQEQIESDPAYIQRQADLKRYSEMLSGLGANIENGWNDQKDFRIELDGIKPDKMEKLVTVIQQALK